MKRKVEWEEEEESDNEDTNASEDEESDDEEPRIKDVLAACIRSFPTRLPPKGLRSITQHGGSNKIFCFGHLVDSYFETSE